MAAPPFAPARPAAPAETLSTRVGPPPSLRLSWTDPLPRDGLLRQFPHPAASDWTATGLRADGSASLRRDYTRTASMVSSVQHAEAAEVRPFGFMNAFQAKADPMLDGELPAVIAPYDKDAKRVAAKACDRRTGKPVPRAALRTYREAVAPYHIHPASRFHNADYTDAGVTERRHASARVSIWVDLRWSTKAGQLHLNGLAAVPTVEALGQEPGAQDGNPLARGRRPRAAPPAGKGHSVEAFDFLCLQVSVDNGRATVVRSAARTRQVRQVQPLAPLRAPR